MLRKPRTFTQLGDQLACNAENPALRTIQVLLPLPIFAVGAVLSFAFGPYIPLGLQVGLLLFGFIRMPRIRRDSATAVAWDDAEAYKRDTLPALPSPAAGFVRSTFTSIEKLGYVPYLYRAECRCGSPDIDVCRCPMRWSAAASTYPGTKNVVIVAGDQLIDRQDSVLAFVLAHERGHLQHRRAFWLRMTIATEGAMVAGIFTPTALLVPVAAALLLLHLLWGWAAEIACDRGAARLHGAAADLYWGLTRRPSARRRASQPWWQRVLWPVARRTHPPAWLRAHLCRRTHVRTLAQGMP
ncbi:hypothetical protein ACFFR3_22105 [Nonomuraea salmonea]|uniref:Peptidase M48 domain-containing protein n=1 Tax=Nonomuraea salmonea TaxID=46181 RepID=A0ABV5NPH5_9ACTN